MTSETKFREPNIQFVSSGTGMTLKIKFREPNLYFMSSRTGKTHCYKFENRLCTLLYQLYILC